MAFLNEHAGRWSLGGQRSKARQVNFTEPSVRFSSFSQSLSCRRCAALGEERLSETCGSLTHKDRCREKPCVGHSFVRCVSATGAWRHRLAVQRGGHGDSISLTHSLSHTHSRTLSLTLHLDSLSATVTQPPVHPHNWLTLASPPLTPIQSSA